MKRIATAALAALGIFTMAACAGNQVVVKDDAAPLTAEQWDAWASNFKAALAAQAAAKTPAEQTQAIDKLAEVAEHAPNADARLMATSNACLIAAAVGDGATLRKFACESGALRGLLGGK